MTEIRIVNVEKNARDWLRGNFNLKLPIFLELLNANKNIYSIMIDSIEQGRHEFKDITPQRLDKLKNAIRDMQELITPFTVVKSIGVDKNGKTNNIIGIKKVDFPIKKTVEMEKLFLQFENVAKTLREVGMQIDEREVEKKVSSELVNASFKRLKNLLNSK